MKKIFLIFFIGTCLNNWAFAQSVDSLFLMARQEAFNQKNYQTSIALCKKVLQKKSQNIEVGLFLGKLYTWTDSVSLARKEFDRLLTLDSMNVEVAEAYIDLEYWNKNNLTALLLCKKFLNFYPTNEALLDKKINLLIALGLQQQAKLFLKGLAILPAYKKNIQSKIGLRNSLSVVYNYNYFNKNTYDNIAQSSWAVRTFAYSYRTNKNNLLIKWQNASRFQRVDNQFIIESYPTISKGLNAYLNIGVGSNYILFPHYRFGTSIYMSLPAQYELEGGFSWLKFQKSVWIYTVSMGKYVGNYFFNIRTYLVPSTQAMLPIFRLSTNYYFNNQSNYLSCHIGTRFMSASTNAIAHQMALTTPVAGILFSKKLHRNHLIRTEFSVLKQFSQPSRQHSLELTYSNLF